MEFLKLHFQVKKLNIPTKLNGKNDQQKMTSKNQKTSTWIVDN